jgi:hypothetical protein
MADDLRRTTITTLLDHWNDFHFERSDDGGSNGDDPDREMDPEWTLFSRMSKHPSVAELRLCLALCARMGPRHYKHLAGFYRSEWRNVDRLVKRRDHRGRMVNDTQRVRERVLPSWIERPLVEHAIDFLLGVWNLDVPLELPKPLQQKLRPLADSDGWTEAA